MNHGGTEPRSSNRLGEDIALLTAYLLSSARGLLDEPSDYGILRLLEGARRTLELLESTGVRDAQFVEVRNRLDDIMYGPMVDMDFERLLDELCGRMADGVKSLPAACSLTMD
jgi:hypothetical protein